VTCYFRHLQEIFKKAGIEVTNANKREIDKVIHEIVGVKYKDCPGALKEVKKRIAENEGFFVSELKEKWSAHS
jgi:molecular chaperone GrpE (heat shock protein)